MPRKKLYTDFEESVPICKPCPMGPPGATRMYIEITCPKCNKHFVDIPVESMDTSKASKCKNHLDTHHTSIDKPTTDDNPATQLAPARKVPLAGESPQGEVAALRSEVAGMREKMEEQHEEMMRALGMRDAMAKTVAIGFRINPDDAITVTRELPRKLESHTKRMDDLQTANSLFGAKQQEFDGKVKRQRAEYEKKLQGKNMEINRLKKQARTTDDLKEALKNLRKTFHPDKKHQFEDKTTVMTAMSQEINNLINGK